MVTNLINSEQTADLEDKVRLYSVYQQYIRSLSDHRYQLFGHFISIHMFLLPAHAVVPYTEMFRRLPGVAIIYSILVAVLGITFCVVSYRRISGNFIRIDAAYKIMHQIELELPYRFFTVMAEMMGDGKSLPETTKWFRPSLRRMELVFHWIIGAIYFSLPFIHHNMDTLARIVEGQS
jgi:hypothetical protein